MKNKLDRVGYLYFIAAILFFLAGIIGDNKVFIPLGFCFIAIGSANFSNKDRNNRQ